MRYDYGVKIANYIINALPSLEGKKIAIAGATAGIGLALAKQCVSKGADLIILARNPEKAAHVIEELHSLKPEAKIDFVPYDQSDFVSVDRAIDLMPDFDVLVMNAAILCPKKESRSPQGHALTLDTNFLGMHRFIEELLPRLKGTHKIVFQGSLAAGFHISKKWDIYDPDHPLFRQYNISKALIESYFRHLASLDLPNLTFCLSEPGISGTNIFHDWKQPMRSIAIGFCKIACHSNEKAALTALKAIIDGANSDYFVPRGPFTFSGFPKKKRFPRKRIRAFLMEKIK